MSRTVDRKWRGALRGPAAEPRGPYLTATIAAFSALFLGACGPRVTLSETEDTGQELSLYARFFGSDPPEIEDLSPTRRAQENLDELVAEAASCRAKIQAAQEQTALPGAPKLEAERALVLARGKSEPVLFLSEPKFTGEVSRGTEARRQALLQTRFPRDVFSDTFRTFRDNPERLRELLLRDGYFYTDDSRAARFLTYEVSLEHLFREPELVLVRGSEELRIKRGEGGYYYASGSETGQRASLLLFDRVSLPGAALGPPLHVDVRELSQREGMSGLRVSQLGEENIIAEVRYEEEWVPALLKREGINLSMDCLLVEPQDASRIGRARDEAYRRTLVLKAVRDAIAAQVRQGLPFDEPRTERGQQDGKLRDRWESAYFGGHGKYKFNGDQYQVYSPSGEALTPQVCVDFVTETLERASGMHFAPQGEKPRKVLGALDFDEILGGARRQELGLRNYARSNPHRLALLDFPQSEWVKYEDIDDFFAFLEKEKDNLRPGDIVVIRGRAAWDRYEEIHTHTFFIYESDPLTGMPTLLAGNAGKPRISTFDGEMLRAPKRSIRHRIRPNAEWLYDHLVLKTPLRGERWSAPLAVTER